MTILVVYKVRRVFYQNDQTNQQEFLRLKFGDTDLPVSVYFSYSKAKFKCLKLFYTVSHHHNDDHGASEHARQAGLLWKVGLLHPSYWVLLHSWGHSCKLWPRTLLRDTR